MSPIKTPNSILFIYMITEEDIFSSMGTFTKRDVSDINKYMHSGETSGKVTDVQMTELGNDKCWNTSEEPTINEAKTTSSWSDSKKSDSWAGSHAAGQWSQDDSDKLRESLNEVMVDVSGTGRWNQDFAAGHSPSVSNSDWLTGSSVINETSDSASGWDLTQTLQVGKDSKSYTLSHQSQFFYVSFNKISLFYYSVNDPYLDMMIGVNVNASKLGRLTR